MEKEDSFSRLSTSIACMRFPLILSIILYHAYIAVPILGHKLYYQIIYPFGLWIGETGVPAYFFISGMFVFYSKKPYLQKMKSRIKTLAIPYIIWNSIMLAAFIIAFFLGYNHIINNVKEIADYRFLDYIRAFWDCGDWNGGMGKPVYPPMWFLRNLMILCILSPLIKLIIEKTSILLPLIVSIIWINTPNMGLTYESISSFCLGAFFPICRINLIDIYNKYSTLMISLFILLGIVDIITHTLFSLPINLQIHRLSIFMNILMLPAIGSFLVNKRLEMKSLSKMSFFIYCIHLPIVIVFRKPASWHPELSNETHILLYFISSIVIITICILFYHITKRIMPLFMRLATGNRD